MRGQSIRITQGDPELRSYVAIQDDESRLAPAVTRNSKHLTRYNLSSILEKLPSYE